MGRKPLIHFGLPSAAQADVKLPEEPAVPITHDRVNHPQHYTSDPSGVECIDITRWRNFNIGNAMKYLWRAGLKDSASHSGIGKHIEDLKKSIWYIEDEIQRLEWLDEDLTNAE